eukprot:833340_1
MARRFVGMLTRVTITAVTCLLASVLPTTQRFLTRLAARQRLRLLLTTLQVILAPPTRTSALTDHERARVARTWMTCARARMWTAGAKRSATNFTTTVRNQRLVNRWIQNFLAETSIADHSIHVRMLAPRAAPGEPTRRLDPAENAIGVEQSGAVGAGPGRTVTCNSRDANHALVLPAHQFARDNLRQT